MTREILFRGKWAENDEWVFGDLRHIFYGEYYPHIVDNSNGLNNSVCGLQVDPATVGQFTGLTDRNGVKVFEGDIVHVKAHSGSFTGCVTYWLEEEPRFVCETKHGLHYAICAKFEFEVLGNIYDNPELLEVSESE